MADIRLPYACKLLFQVSGGSSAGGMGVDFWRFRDKQKIPYQGEKLTEEACDGWHGALRIGVASENVLCA